MYSLIPNLNISEFVNELQFHIFQFPKKSVYQWIFRFLEWFFSWNRKVRRYRVFYRLVVTNLVHLFPFLTLAHK